MRYILILLLLSATMFRTAAQENYTLADTTKTQNIYQRQWLSDAKNQERFGGS